MRAMAQVADRTPDALPTAPTSCFQGGSFNSHRENMRQQVK